MEAAALPNHIYECTNSYLHLWVDTAVKFIYTEWLTRPTASQYRQAALMFYRILQKYEVAYWFMDANYLTGLSLDEQRKVIDELAPAVAASSLKKVARVIYQDDSNRPLFEETVMELQNKHQATVAVQQFWTFHEAANWITVIRA